MEQSIVGIHCIAELYGCPFELLDDEKLVRDALRQAAQNALTTLIHLRSHKFAPHGVTALGLLAESHVSIHTWPQVGYAAADVFTCGKRSDPYGACELLAGRLKAQQYEITTLQRGVDVLKIIRKDQCDATATGSSVIVRFPPEIDRTSKST